MINFVSIFFFVDSAATAINQQNRLAQVAVGGLTAASLKQGDAAAVDATAFIRSMANA